MDKVEPPSATALNLALVHLRSLCEPTAAFVSDTPLLIVAAVAAAVGDAVGRSGYVLNPVVFLFVLLILLAAVRRRAALAAALLVAAAALLTTNGLAYRVCHPALPADHVARLANRSSVSVEGTLRSRVPLGAQRARVLLDVERAHTQGEWQAARGRIQISVQETTRAWRAGERIRVPLRLRRPRNFGNPGEFDYEGFLAIRGVYATAFLRNDSTMIALGDAGPTWWSWLPAWRSRVAELMARTLPEPQSTVLAALIIGTDVPLPRPVRDPFARAGVSHVLAISGLHVGLVATAGYAVLRWLLARSQWLLLCAPVPKLAVAAAVVPVLLYAGIAGGSVATRRAVIMIVVFLAAVLVDRQRNLMVALAVAALAILLAAPGSSLDISFQLSFVAVMGLSFGIERFWGWWRDEEEKYLLRLRASWRTRLVRALALYFAVSASAQAATIPLAAFHFNQISLVAPIANALVVPLLGSLAVILGLSAALLLPFSELAATVAIELAGPVVQLGITLTRLCAALPGAALRVVSPSLLELALIYLALLALVLSRGGARRRVFTVIAIVASIDAAVWYAHRHLHRDLRVTFLSVGQGDSAIVELPGGEVMVVDAGGSYGADFDIGERVVAPFLWGRKIGRVDYLVLSHPDRDHYGGLAFLATHFAPRELWSTGASSPGESFAAFTRAVDESGARVVRLRAGDRRALGATAIHVLSPDQPHQWNDNDASLVFSVDFAGRRLLFAGDIQKLAEASLARAAADLHSTVLKVPHHGSRTSSTAPFLALVQPAVAVISTGFDNRFHFPAPDVLQRYAQIDAAVLRTDLDGAIQVWVDPAGAVTIAGGRGAPARPPSLAALSANEPP